MRGCQQTQQQSREWRGMGRSERRVVEGRKKRKERGKRWERWEEIEGKEERDGGKREHNNDLLLIL